jgi:hypothetical protein
MFIFTVHYRKVQAENRVDGGHILPRKGYQTICVTEEVYKYVQTKAKETNRSIPEYIKYLIELEKGNKGER